MLNMLKNKKCLVASALVLLLSFPAKATELIEFGLGNKYDYFDTSMPEIKPEDAPLVKFAKELEEAGMNINFFRRWIGGNTYDIAKIASVDLDKDPKELYENSYVLANYFDNQTKYANLEVVEFKRDKNRLPEEFVAFVKIAKKYMKQVYDTLDEFFLYNYTYYYVGDSDYGKVEADFEKGVLILSKLPYISEFVYSDNREAYYSDKNEYSGGIVIDVSLDELKKLSLHGKFDFALNLSFEKEKGSFRGEPEKSTEELMLNHQRPTWKLKAISSKMRVADASGGYDQFKKPFQERELGTLEVRNPRVCKDSEFKDCIKLEVF